MSEYYVTDKGYRYLEELRDLGESVFDSSTKIYDYSTIIVVDKGTSDEISYIVDKYPESKQAFRRLFEAGYIETV